MIKSSPELVADRSRFDELINIGSEVLVSGDIEKLRKIMYELFSIQFHATQYVEIFDVVNITRG